MPKFTDSEIIAIKDKLNEGNVKALRIVLLWSPPICLLMPYLPGRKGSGSMIETMSYWDAVLQISIIVTLILIGLWFWNKYKINKQFLDGQKYLRKKKVKTFVKRKSKSAFSFYDNLLTTGLEGEYRTIKINKEQSGCFRIKDKIQIEYEEHTNTILSVEKEAN